MSPAIEAAIRALDDLADSRHDHDWIADGHRYSFLKEREEACKAFFAAQSAAIQAMRDAIPGPRSSEHWGGFCRGNRALVWKDQVFVLVEPDQTIDMDEPTIIILPVSAIVGLTGGDS